MAEVFHPHASGLLVPDDLARAREVWTNDQWKTIKRALQFLGDQHIAVVMRCAVDGCRNAPMETQTTPEGGLLLRCPHKDRVIRRG